MKLAGGIHLAYCTNIHRGETWPEILGNLERHALAVRERVCPDKPYALGLRLGATAARQLNDLGTLADFQRWLDHHGCYVFTINGFPYGRFHGTRVKEQVYSPDWTTHERLEYTQLLFDLLARLVPAGVEGSVSTLPGSFKEFIASEAQEHAMRANLWRCVEHLDRLSESSGRALHLGLEPEPLCYLETSAETVRFFDEMRADRPDDPRLERHLGINYDACHLAVEFEEPREALTRLRQHGVPVSKIHLSSALALIPTAANREALRAFAEDTYLHQVVSRDADGRLHRYRDLDLALADPAASTADGAEWRVHFHIPLHAQPTGCFGTTTGHLLGLLDLVEDGSVDCGHFEMETYTWEVMPASLRRRDVVDQLVNEHEWTLARFAERGFGSPAHAL